MTDAPPADTTPRPGAPPPDLVHLVRLAYSAERAAAFAYRGHARAAPRQRDALARIERDEWDHRATLRGYLDRLGSRPSRWWEAKYAAIGIAIAAACFVIGWFMPMYFAGRLESGNVNEYLTMARLARGTVLRDEIACILHMAAVEKQHEEFFAAQVAGHRLTPWFMRMFRWGPTLSFNPMPASGLEHLGRAG